MAITAEDLHSAADLIGTFGDDEGKIGLFGLPIEALHDFVDNTTWRDFDADGPECQMDSLALAIGISIGVIASRDFHHDEAADEAREAAAADDGFEQP